MIGTFKMKKDKVEATEWILLRTVTSCVSPVLEKNDPEGMFLLVILFFYAEHLWRGQKPNKAKF